MGASDSGQVRWTPTFIYKGHVMLHVNVMVTAPISELVCTNEAKICEKLVSDNAIDNVPPEHK